jgi:hypothetical protein
MIALQQHPDDRFHVLRAERLADHQFAGLRCGEDRMVYEGHNFYLGIPSSHKPGQIRKLAILKSFVHKQPCRRFFSNNCFASARLQTTVALIRYFRSTAFSRNQVFISSSAISTSTISWYFSKSYLFLPTS